MQTISRPGVDKFLISSLEDRFPSELDSATSDVPPGSLLETPFPIPTMNRAWYLKRKYIVEIKRRGLIFIHGTGSFDPHDNVEDEAIITIEFENFDRKGTIRITSC
jgi:hypothetical protein